MGIKSFFSLVFKNFKLFYRSKLSTLSILLFPLIILVLIGFVFNSSEVSNVDVGYYLNEDSGFTYNLFSALLEKGFSLKRFSSNDECLDSLRFSDVQMCLDFPNDFSEEGSSENIEIYVDSSRVNLAYSVLHEINIHLSNASSELGDSFAKKTFARLNQIQSLIEEEMSNLDDSLYEIQSARDSISERTEVPKYKNEISDLKKVSSNLNGTSDGNKIESGIALMESFEKYSVASEDLFESTQDALSQAEETLSDNLLRSEEISSKFDDIDLFDIERIGSPIKTKINSITSGSSNLDFLLPTLFSLIGLFGGILLSSSFVLKERKTKAYFRNFMTPTKGITFLIADYIACLSILLVQFILIFLGFYFVFNMTSLFSQGAILTILFLALSVFVFIGVFIGYLFKSEESIVFSSVIVASFMMLFSNTILPIETFFGNLKHIAKFNPLVVCDLALRKVILFGYGFRGILNEIYILLGFFVALFLLSALLRGITKKSL